MLVVAALLVLNPKYLRDLAGVLAEGISNFKGGGPGSPSHPIPGNDSFILTRRRRRRSDELS